MKEQPFPKPTYEQKEELAYLHIDLIKELNFNIFTFIGKVKRSKGYYPPIKLMIDTSRSALKSKPKRTWGYFKDVLEKELPNYFADLNIQEHQSFKKMPIGKSIKEIMKNIGGE